MNSILEKLDSVAGIRLETGVAKILDRAAFVFFALMLLSSPHSIAATQIAGGLGILFWIARHFVTPIPKTKATFLVIPILALYAWTIVSAVYSYAPDISMPKLRGEILFFIFFFGINQLRNRKAIKLAAGALIFSCMVNVIWMPLERLVGKGVKVETLNTRGPLFTAGFRDGDGLFNIGKQKVSNPDDIVEEIEKSGEAKITYYRDGHYWAFAVAKSDFLPGTTSAEKLGIKSWSTSRSWRSAGFYGHYTTYAEVLQLIGSLVFGLLIAGLGLVIFGKRPSSGNGNESDPKEPKQTFGAAHFRILGILALCLGLIALALVLTITRAAQAGFLASVVVIVLMIGSRKLFAALILILVPVILGSVIFLQQTRSVGYFDLSDESTNWRLKVYHEGLDIATKSPRNFIFGVGVDSIKRFANDWKIYENGIVAGGHFHSTPIQMIVERGFIGLVFWLSLFVAYLWTLFRCLRKNRFGDWMEKGIVLGAFGGAIGFLVSGLVHYNYGDAEVLMVVYILMAISVSLAQITSDNTLPTPGALSE